MLSSQKARDKMQEWQRKSLDCSEAKAKGNEAGNTAENDPNKGLGCVTWVVDRGQ
jgi:hypothetical protein